MAKFTVEFTDRGIEDFAFILGKFLEVQKYAPLDSRAEDIALELLRSIPKKAIKETKRYHGNDFFGQAFKLIIPTSNTIKYFKG